MDPTDKEQVITNLYLIAKQTRWLCEEEEREEINRLVTRSLVLLGNMNIDLSDPEEEE